MTNKDYQEVVEEKHGKPLRDIMYELCVEKDVVAYEGANILEVPKQTFIAWRNRYRFGPLQLRADAAEVNRNKQIAKYNSELEGVDITRPLLFEGEISLRGFKEILDRYLELAKLQRAQTGVNELSIILKIGTLEQAIKYLEDYHDGALKDNFVKESIMVDELYRN